MQNTAHEKHPLNTDGFAHPGRNVDILDIEKEMYVADFGSGSGAYVLAIAEKLANTGHVYAVDIQKDLLRRTINETKRRGFTNVTPIWADLEKKHACKLRSGTLDIVLVSNLLFQVEDKNAILIEARRLLHSGGRLIMIDWSDSFGGLGPRPQDVMTQEAALNLAHTHGFATLREFRAGAHHWGVVMRLSGNEHQR